MRITIHTADESVTFNATRVATDEHNNLEVMGGIKGDKPLALFNKECWESALYGQEVTDGQERTTP